MSRASSLFRLQEIDLEMARLTARQAEIEGVLSDTVELDRRRAAATEAEDAYRSAHAGMKSAEHAVMTQREKIQKTEGALYSGTISNPKELQDLQLEAESLQRFLQTLEDRLLEAMVDLDDVEQARDEAKEALESFEAWLAQTHEGLIEERAHNTAKLERAEQEREAALASVSEEDLRAYQRLRERLGGVAMAVLEEGNCSACGLSQAASIQQTIRSGSELVRCKQCGRILYAG